MYTWNWSKPIEVAQRDERRKKMQKIQINIPNNETNSRLEVSTPFSTGVQIQFDKNIFTVWTVYNILYTSSYSIGL